MKQLSALTAFRLFTVLCVSGALISLYLLVHHLEHRLGLTSGKSFCSINDYFDCDKVATSPFSEVFGFPVAGFGILFFASNLLMLSFLKTQTGEGKTWSLLKLSSLLGIIPVVGLASISIIVIKSICIFCFASYLCALGLGIISFRLNISKGNFVVDGIKLFFTLIQKHSSLLPLILVFALFSLLAPMLVVNRYRQDVPSLQLSNENRAIQAWKNGVFFEESQRFISDGADRDVFFGDPSSPVTVISYSDMGCPHCKVIASVLHQLSANYHIKLVFKDYPLDLHCNRLITTTFHEYSCQAAKITRCALLTDEKLYSEVHQSIYSLEPLSDTTLKPIEVRVSASSNAAAQCLNQAGYPKSILRHLEEGMALKIPGTPAIFINGKIVTTPTPAAIEKILKLALDPKQS